MFCVETYYTGPLFIICSRKFTFSGNGAKRRYRFKKPSEGGAYRKRQNLHEASLLIILTARDILKPRNGKKNIRLV